MSLPFPAGKGRETPKLGSFFTYLRVCVCVCAYGQGRGLFPVGLLLRRNRNERAEGEKIGLVHVRHERVPQIALTPQGDVEPACGRDGALRCADRAQPGNRPVETFRTEHEESDLVKSIKIIGEALATLDVVSTRFF